MSSDYESEGSVTTIDGFEILDDIIEKFCSLPRSRSNVRFGHLTLPGYFTTKYNVVDLLSSSIHEATESTQVFVLTRKEQRIFSSFLYEHMPMLLWGDQTIDHAEFCSILEWCRVEPGTPEDTDVWAEGGERWWKCDKVLPKQVFIAFSLDPWMSAACALALTGLVQWACDMAQTSGANIRVLTFSNFYGNSLLSELVSLRSQQPVEHFELPIPTHFHLIPDAAIDLTHEEHIYSTIQSRMSPLNAESRNAVLVVPPINREDFFPGLQLAHDVRYQYLLMRNVIDSGETMHWSLRNRAPGFGRTVTVIQVDLKHPIPDVLNGFERIHIVLGKRCMRTVFDEETKQIVKTEVSITQSELDALQWWCFQLNNPFPYLRIYAGREGLSANEDAAVYRPLHIMNDHAGAFISGVYGMSTWGIDPERVVECFMKSTPVISQVTSLLRKEGVIHGRLPRFAFTGTEEATYRIALRTTGYDHRIAHFFALPSSDKKVLLLKAQLAVVLTVSKDWTIQIDPKNDFGADVPVFGWGANLANHGDLWQVLGMWKAIAVRWKEFASLLYPLESVWDATGYLRLPIGAADHFFVTNRDLKKALSDSDMSLGLPSHRIEDETESLDDDHMREVMRHLLRAFQHQLIATRLGVVHGEAHLKHTVVSTGKCVELRSKRTVSPLPDAIFKDLERNGVLYGICTEFIKEPDSLLAMNWTFIPQNLVAEYTRTQN
ncbi:uncharacterized protein FPRO_10322 [Fusarium proliferatum ET1]|uniref:Uncharacterized protein n=1 Tax=Fusarium proliferatum (strain ET1) TaxID=1227346 RepID=A0A1L7VJX4_FUSPR|nr:uncharacterized protein FPRO_10322 [Fusarium proliferatum ET1]CZR40734.1 uncharacterized protein FPRO_10322 [Fusarium proliferatum ET1]